MCLFYVYTVPIYIYFYTPTLKLQNNFQFQQIDAHSKAVGKLQELLKGWALRGWLKVKQHQVKKTAQPWYKLTSHIGIDARKVAFVRSTKVVQPKMEIEPAKNNGFKVKP